MTLVYFEKSFFPPQISLFLFSKFLLVCTAKVGLCKCSLWCIRSSCFQHELRLINFIKLNISIYISPFSLIFYLKDGNNLLMAFSSIIKLNVFSVQDISYSDRCLNCQMPILKMKIWVMGSFYKKILTHCFAVNYGI